MESKAQRCITIETKLKILFNLKTYDEFYFIKYGMDLFSEDGVDIKIYNIENIVLRGTLITPKQLKSESQEHKFTIPRQIIWYLTKKKYPKISDERIGAYHNRKRLTTTNGIRRVKHLMGIYPKTKNLIEDYELLTLK